MSRARIPPDWEVLRLRLVYAVMLAGFLLIGARLWWLQVAKSEVYAARQESQSVRRVRIPGIRGLMLDRAGVPLAENRPAYSLVLFLEDLRPTRRGETTLGRIRDTLAELSRRLGRPCALTDDELKRHLEKERPLPLVAWSDLDPAAVARWAEQADDLPGVDLVPDAVRVYPQGVLAAHVLGYVGRASFRQDAARPVHFAMEEMAGREGLEKRYDPLLRGRAGEQLVRVDVAGYRHALVGGEPPQAGRDLRLSLDARIQRLAEEALGEDPGVVVVLDPADGAVLAMASRPTFDPNRFVPAIPHGEWRTFLADTLKPLLNRATLGEYAPGSIFKPLVALAALGRGAITPATTWVCPGYFERGRRWNCFHRTAHGPVNLHDGLMYSCNVYFCQAGLAAGPEAIAAMARSAGLGAPTGIDLGPERAGLVPDAAWKRRVQRDGWRDGDTCNLSIGQGALTVTPLQMAVVAAALANGGRRVHPQLLLGSRPHGAGPFEPAPARPPEDLGWNPTHLRWVREGMRAVAMDEHGTGRAAQVPGYVVAAKTGTAEYGPAAARKTRGWMIAFAPYDAPRVAVAALIEDAESGGRVVGPRVGRLLAGILGPAAPAPAADGGQG